MIYVAILGPPLCGKRTFINKGLGKETNFSILKDNRAERQLETHEYKKKYNYGNGKIYDIEFSVFPYSKNGNYEFNNKTDFFIIIFDIGNEDSFNKAKEILDVQNVQDNIISFNEKKCILKNVFLIGNKADLYSPSNYCQAQKFCEQKKFRYYETSTKNEKLLDIVVKEMIISFDEEMFSN